MKFSRLTRIYNKNRLELDSILIIESELFEYLTKVLRLKPASNVRIFNQNDGEYSAQIQDIQKKSLKVLVKEKLRAPVLARSQKLILAMSIIKTNKMLEAIDMATQLGVDEIIPIIAERSQQNNINIKKCEKVIIESTEQSERLNPPTLALPMVLRKIDSFNWLIIYADENEHNKTIKDIQNLANQDIMLLIGPEGGFTDQELSFLSELPNAHSITLGSNILRAETAACAAFAQLQMMLQ
jgi:16S rRNA (uracil1498-N3)-methyltransferase